jgi:ankyrin repeat protein
LYKNIDIVKFLLTYGKIEIDVNIGNPLFHAVGNNEVEMVKLLLGHPSIRIEESGSITPLRMAVINRFEDIVKLLLDHYCKDLEKKTEKDIIMYREDINYNIRMVSKLISEYNGEEDIITIYMRIDNLLKEALSKIDVVYSANPVKDMPAILEEVTPAGLQEVTPAGLQEVTPAGLEEDTGNPPPVDDE